MCGIAGGNLKRSGQAALQRWLDAAVAALHHRGPDDNGAAIIPLRDGSAIVGIANTRLAILDLTAAGHQPMHDPATGNWVVLNGEIYNHLEIREELGAAAGPWKSGSDTETVLRAYGRWGPDAVQKFRGMFAVAVFDAAREVLWCARDRLGIKPLYFWAGDEGVLFASEVRALLRCGMFQPRCDPAGLAHFVRFGSVSDPYTLIEGVQALPAGCCMEVQGGRILSVRQYWGMHARHEMAMDGDPRRTIALHLERAVGEHMLSDVPVASLLSGGMDSSIITALAARHSGHRIRTFTVCFSGTALDESTFAKSVAQRYKTEHYEITVSPDEVLEQVPAAVNAMDLPSADGVNTFVVTRAVARTATKVILSGLGGDELFGGYRSFRLVPLAHRWSAMLSLVPAGLLARGAGTARAIELTRAHMSLADRYFSLRSFWSVTELDSMGITLPRWRAWEKDQNQRSRVEISALELAHYMRNVLLRDADTMSMAHSVELRVPFLDHKLVEYCVRTGAARPGKRLLLDVFAHLLPRESYERRKRGFELPMEEWMRGPLASFVQQGLARLDHSGLLPAVRTAEFQRAFDAKRLGWSRLWQMAVLGHWADRHLAAVPVTSTVESAATPA